MPKPSLSPPRPLETLVDVTAGPALPLPPELEAFYGALRFPAGRGRPHVVANFAETLDGVVALDGNGKGGGEAITAGNPADRALMGLLRASADAVIVGAGTLRSVPHHLWTGEYIFPPLSVAYERLRARRGGLPQPLNVIVSRRGDVDLSLPVFSSGRVPALLLTSEEGERRLQSHSVPSKVSIASLAREGPLLAKDIVAAVRDRGPSELILVEGGPHLMGAFFEERALDELFLTISPQVAGRASDHLRLGLVEGRVVGPAPSAWGSLASLKRSESHVFLRYEFPPRT